jgi:hypothetical protein
VAPFIVAGKSNLNTPRHRIRATSDISRYYVTTTRHTVPQRINVGEMCGRPECWMQVIDSKQQDVGGIQPDGCE